MAVINPPFIRPQYTGLNEAEWQYLRDYLRTVDAEIVGLETRVRLGPGEVLPSYERQDLRIGWQKASQLKADAVLETTSEIRVVELKDFVRTSAMGQLQQYRYYYQLEKSPQKPVSMVVTGPDMNPSAALPLRAAGIDVVMTQAAGKVHYAQGLASKPPFGLD